MKSYFVFIIPLVAGILIVLVASALAAGAPEQKRRFYNRVTLWTSIVVLLLSALLTLPLIPGTRLFGDSFLVTGTARSFAVVFLLLTALVVLLTDGYFAKVHVNGNDWRLIVLCMSLGAVHLIFANNLPTFFMAFQLVSIPTYALVGFARIDRRSNEAGMKYLILGLLTGALLLLGLSLLYGATGEIEFTAMRAKLMAAGADDGSRHLAIVAMVLVCTAFFFKIAAAPFHSYLLDVYQGSNFAATLLVAVPAKIVYFAAVWRLLDGPLLAFDEIYRPVCALVALLSFFAGGVQGLTQNNLKRILACSAVLNAGFLLLAIVFAQPAVLTYYLLAYGLMNIALIAFWMALGRRHADADTLADLDGLATRDRSLALGMTVVLLSFAGIPLTAGFLSKFLVIFAVFEQALSGPSADVQVWVAVLGIFASVLAAFFYFRMIRHIWFRHAAPQIPAAAGPADRRWTYMLVGWLAAILLLVLGVWPLPLLG